MQFSIETLERKKRMCDYHGQTNDAFNSNLSGRHDTQITISAVGKPGFLNLICIHVKTQSCNQYVTGIDV